MNSIASEELIEMEYTKVSRLKGGMLAWQKKSSKASSIVIQSSVLI
jgi:rhodanese-related sulfurtransferase